MLPELENRKEVDGDRRSVLRTRVADVVLNGAANGLTNKRRSKPMSSRPPEKKSAGVDRIYWCYDQDDQGRIRTPPSGCHNALENEGASQAIVKSKKGRSKFGGRIRRRTGLDVSVKLISSHSSCDVRRLDSS